MKKTIIAVLLVALGTCNIQALRELAPKRGPYRWKQEPSTALQDMSNTEKELFIAAAQGNTEKVAGLITVLDPNIKDSSGNTPLFYAKNLRTVKLLINNGADVNAQNDDGVTSLHMNVVLGRIRFVNYLLNRGADVNITTNKGATALQLATMISYFEDPKRAIGAAAGAVAVGAVAVGAAEDVAAIATVDILVRNRILERLLQAGADPNARGAGGLTALHTLAMGRLLKPGNRRGSVIMAKHLIRAGAKRDFEGTTPYDVARKYKRFLLMPVLNPIRPRKRVAQTAKRLARPIETGGKWVQEKLPRYR